MDPQGARTFILAKLKNELPADRTYHSLEHTLDVFASVVDIAEKENVTGEGLELLKVAALYHDVGFTEKDLDHENVGCRIARESLPGFGFDAKQIEKICAMILATRIPQAPRNKLARILCDADLDYLGRADFDSIGQALYIEMKAYGVLHTERQWNELQVRFLERHHYFTVTNKRHREPMKQEHLARVKQWLIDNP
ncbi:MAG: HD domain-containing protein [Flavobacteriales bacterium]|nr:HD domain-containing protein [Flavobacteriales bacterium]